MIDEFKTFLERGNVMDLAVAVIMGGAFGAIVTSFVQDLFMPLVGMLIGGIDFSALALTVGDAQILYGNFLQAVTNFLLIAIALFLIVRAVNRLQSLREAQADQDEPPAPSLQETLLMEIRDLLREGR